MPLATLLDYLEAGQPLSEYLEDFHSVTREQAVAAPSLPEAHLPSPPLAARLRRQVPERPTLRGSPSPHLRRKGGERLVLKDNSLDNRASDVVDTVPTAGGPMTTPYDDAQFASAPIRLAEGRMFFDVDQLLSYAETNRSRYLNAKPFPHLVVDNFFPESVLDQALRDFPSAADCTWREFKDSRHVKLLSRGDTRLAPSIRHVLAQLRTSEFLAFLEILSGMEGLVADPHSGGCHETPPGGFLEVHVDASWNERLALYTGINLFVYLNKEWREEFGGHLELWDTDCTECQTRILPVFNRMVIFSSGETTFHGHPLPLRCPEGIGRKSLAANFCLSRRPDHQTGFRRSAVYRANPSHRLSPNLLAQMLTPPIISEHLRRVKRKRKGVPTAC